MISPVFLDIAVVLIGVFVLLYEAFAKDRDKSFVALLGGAGLALVFVLSFFAAPQGGGDAGTAPYWRFYSADFLALFFKRLALLTTIGVLVMAVDYRGVVRRSIFGAEGEAGLGEFFALPVLTCAGLMWMASAVDFVLIFVALELVTVSFYVLVAYLRRNPASLEAGVKYLILGALSTAFFVYGIAWIFGMTGETNLARIAAALATREEVARPVLFGVLLVFVGLGFKVAAVPFQFWVPDVYQGAPTPVTAFLSVGSKAAGFVVLMRVVEAFAAVPWLAPKVLGAVALLAGATLVYGNLAALPQSNLKRLLAYSSIAHAGYLLVAVASLGADLAGVAIGYYLAAYLPMTLLAFAVLIAVTKEVGGDEIGHFGGLARRSPLLAFGMLVAMLSLAGVPFTGGFIGKLLVFVAAFQCGHYWLIALGAVGVAAGFYYYLKVVRAMYWQEPLTVAPLVSARATKVLVIALVASVFLLGVFPQPVLRLLSPRAAAPQTAGAATPAAPAAVSAAAAGH